MKRTSSFVILLLCILSLPALCQAQCDSIVAAELQKYGVQFSNNNSVVVFKNGQEKFDDLFPAIRRARHSVHLEYFNFRNDSIASMLFDILAEKVKEGVKVRALFDGFGNDSNNQPLKKKHLRNLRERGIEIYEFDPIRFPWVNHIWPRDHRKIVVIDSKIAYTGGMNVADYYIKGTPQVGTWRDMHCRIEGNAVDELQKIFLRMWNKVTKQRIADTDSNENDNENDNHQPSALNHSGSFDTSGLKPDTTPTCGRKTVGIVNREPRTSNEIMRVMYCTSIDNAKSHIQIINPYFTLLPCVKKALRRALKRGVNVEIMISLNSDVPLTPDCVFFQAHTMMKCGAKVYVYKPGFHHSKIMTVDDNFCTIGSTNLDARSLSCDYEVNALILDHHTTAELMEIFENDKKDCFLLTPETWNQMRTRWQKTRGWFAHLLSPFL